MIIGLDMGGTHVDAVLIEDLKVIKTVKNIVDHNNLFDSILKTIKELVQNVDINLITKVNLSTTISTNAIVENEVDNVGMIIQSGLGLPNKHLQVGNKNIFIDGYTDHRGIVVKEVEDNELEHAVKTLHKHNINDIAIVTKFSTRNNETENEIKDKLKDSFDNITVGHKMSGKLNFPRRVNTAYLNASVKNVFKRFVNNISKALKELGIKAPIAILKADGGIMNLDSAIKMPVETILSGPAASYMGINHLLPTDSDAILLDIGGTTTDIFYLADGDVLFEPEGITINEYKTLVRAIFSESIGIGGDSAIKVVDGKLKIGPKRMGPPYAMGGKVATPTDAMIYLEKLKLGSHKRSKVIMQKLAKELKITKNDVATLILETFVNEIKYNTEELLKTINTRPVYTIEEVLDSKKIKPEVINVIGGPAKVLAPLLEKAFKCNVKYPEAFDVANAIGAGLAKTTAEVTMLVNTATKSLTVPELGLKRKVDRFYSMKDARDEIKCLLVEKAESLGATKEDLSTEITEESVYNMVDGFHTKGKNIRLKAQIKPGLIGKDAKDGKGKK